MEDELTKSTQLRNNEYYCMQEKFDFLYNKSHKNTIFYDLIKFIIDDDNLKLAFRNIKTNKGSETKGLSGKCITFIKNIKLNIYLGYIKNKIKYYNPSKVKRVGIPKSNGKIRYLGIKEPWDKIIEQAIYQVLEPIIFCKFHNNSNGFIKGRSQARAIAQFNNYVIKNKLYYVIDLDIKGFFDNVNHGKLLKQLWSCGLRDKNLLCLISKMLKAEVFKVGIPDKGTPQGGILSPLLANIVLNEFDWWLESKSKKGIKFVRFADDVKILCPTYLIARDMLDKIKKWLSERLMLEVSDEKTKIVNLKKNYSYFLGFKFKLKKKKNKYHMISHIDEKRVFAIEIKVKKQLRMIKKTITDKKRNASSIEKYNSTVIGIHNYYKKATHVKSDLRKMQSHTGKYLRKHLSNFIKYDDKVIENDFITTNYGNGKKLPYIRGKPIVPIGRISYDPKGCINNTKNFFDEKSRRKFHKVLNIPNLYIINEIRNNISLKYNTVEFNDNVISKFCGQLGKYYITNEMIINSNDAFPIKILQNENNKYDNIIIVNWKVKELILMKEVEDKMKIFSLKKGLNSKQIEKINTIRKENNLVQI